MEKRNSNEYVCLEPNKSQWSFIEFQQTRVKMQLIHGLNERNAIINKRMDGDILQWHGTCVVYNQKGIFRTKKFMCKSIWGKHTIKQIT